jgi:hypothetical protein
MRPDAPLGLASRNSSHRVAHVGETSSDSCCAEVTYMYTMQMYFVDWTYGDIW